LEPILKPKLGFIGAGSIAKSHIEAAEEAGFALQSICGNLNSERARKISQEYKFKNYFSNYESLLNSDFDAISLITNTEATLKILKILVDYNVPILVEKPVTTHIQEFDQLDLSNNKVLVGYNRRFYSSIQELKKKIENEDFHFAKFNISELSWNSNSLQDAKTKMVLENSVHSLDLVKYLFGNYRLEKIQHNLIKNELSSILVLIKNNQNKLIEITISFGLPTNNYIEIWFSNNVAVCKPIENYSEFSSMKMFPPDKEVSYKRYIPEEINNWKISEADQRFKPGFLEQYKELRVLVNGGSAKKGATLKDAQEALLLALRILKNE
jgi:predicted dehydrogenase